MSWPFVFFGITNNSRSLSPMANTCCWSHLSTTQDVWMEYQQFNRVYFVAWKVTGWVAGLVYHGIGDCVGCKACVHDWLGSWVVDQWLSKLLTNCLIIRCGGNLLKRWWAVITICKGMCLQKNSKMSSQDVMLPRIDSFTAGKLGTFCRFVLGIVPYGNF